MAMSGNFTLFTNDSGGAASSADYVKDAFKDFTLPATSNAGLTDSASTNPVGVFLGNNDCTTYTAKTLWIKDIVRVENKSKWINNKPTYRIIWHETFPAAFGYVFGDFFLSAEPDQDSKRIDVKQLGDGIGVTGKIRRVAFICEQKDFTASGQFVVDGVSGGTVTLSGGSENYCYGSSNSTVRNNYFSPRLHSSSDETNDLHDIRVVSGQTSSGQTPRTCALSVTGVIVYYDNSGSNIECNPGSTYVNKSKNTTAVGATFSLPSYSSSMGGVASVVKAETGGYTLIPRGFSTVLTIAQGLSGTNLLTVSTGHGASFPRGSGVVINQGGGSYYVGSVQSVSTDTLTVLPTLSFGISNSMYRAWQSGPTIPINASLMAIVDTIDFGNFYSFSKMIADRYCRYYIWGSGSVMDRTTTAGVQALSIGTSGFLRVDGRFSAADIEFIGGITSAISVSVGVNGTVSWSENAFAEKSVKRTLFTDAPNQWNTVVIGAGSSMGHAIKRITLYDNAPASASFGMLSSIQSAPGYAGRSAINASNMAFGTHQRVYANQLGKTGPWEPSVQSSYPGSSIYYGNTTTCVTSLTYYGKDFAIIGEAGGGTLSVDGVGVGLSFGFIHTVGSEGWHTVQYSAGVSAVLAAIDYTRSIGEAKSEQRFEEEFPVIIEGKPENSGFFLWIRGPNGYGSTATKIPRFSSIIRISGDAATYSDSAEYGTLVVINRPGIYQFSYVAVFSAASMFGISINSSQLTTDIDGINVDNIAGLEYSDASGSPQTVSVTMRVYPGDMIRPHAAAVSAGTNSIFRVVRVGD